MSTKSICRFLTILLCLLLLTACMTVGREFPVAGVARIEIGKTTRGQIVDLFGTPWRTGIEDGKKVWTYAHYRYGITGQHEARDLVVRFDDQGLVTSYSFSSSVPGEGELR
ncbi:MAG: outer membrane protein assembly factor BamE [Desulfuromonadales bacterium]|nr:outer membrane protein assembly factor BamE [Desulfuromonadales bacterium]